VTVLPGKRQDKSDKYFELWESLARAQHAIYTARERQLREYGITPDQAYILLRVHQLKNKATQTQIAYFIFRKANTVSVNVKRMENQGLLKRNIQRNRKGGVTLSLTKKGEDIYQKTLNREPIDNIMSSLSAEQIRQLGPCLETLFVAAANELAKFNTDSFLKTILNNLTSTQK
jgi:MarR family 2-MHQ and catechol resistance regulon transcriptional repressor